MIISFRDREGRTTRSPTRFVWAGYIFYHSIEDELEEPNSFEEILNER